MKKAMAIALIVLGALLALGADGEPGDSELKGRTESYWRDNQSANFYEDKDGTDSIADISTTVDTYLLALTSNDTTNTLPNRVGTRQNLSVSLRFTNAAASATYYVVTYNKTTAGVYFPLQIEGPFTVTATAVQYLSHYLSEAQVYDSYGATHAAILVTNVSAGTVDIAFGSF